MIISMIEKKFITPKGEIHYWQNDLLPSRQSLVFLPGLTADHRLFDSQVSFFAQTHNVLVWDAPGHGSSRPFSLDFSLDDKARYLHQIISLEGLVQPVLCGQSMGGYVAQCYLELFPNAVSGLVAIDSAPLKRHYSTALELWLLRHAEPMYRLYPWHALLKSGSKGCCISQHGQQQMRTMMMDYTKTEYCKLAGHGYRMIAAAIAANRSYHIPCPALLLCGEHDKAGSTLNYNRRWAATEHLHIQWIAAAGHNSNVDNPDAVNAAIEKFAKSIHR